INTLKGNVNWMHARESILASPLFGADLKKLFPIIAPGGSDSANFDNAVELLFQAGRTMPHAMAMLIPEAWSSNEHMNPDKKAFYEYHASLMEPWDGPAAIAFTDGRIIGATLDRNGLRPARYLVTDDGLAMRASETGVLPVNPEEVVMKICASSFSPWPSTARSPLARWAPTRLCPACRTARSRCSTISSSCSPRSPIPPSTRSVKRW